MFKLIVLIACSAAYIFWQSPQIGALSTPSHFYAPTKEIRYFTFGEDGAVADTLWLRVIQDFDYCENKALHKKCEDGWVFHMLDLITDLDPKFYIPYIAGATILSVLVDDTQGAAQIFAKGIAQFPTDWPLLYRAGYHAMAEEKDLVKAADYFRRSSEHGAPWWVPRLVARLYDRAGRKEIARQVLVDFLKTADNDKERDMIRERIRQLDEPGGLDADLKTKSQSETQ